MSTQQIGRFEVVAPLATGGMGELLLARERGPAGFERLVVVKRILPQVAEQPEMVESFLREARLVARLNHANIVQIIELGQLESGDYYIAMEYLEGSSVAELRVLCEALQRRVPLEVIASIGVQACRGLEAAHDLRDADGSPVGLIHRDVTPQNLMCTTRGFVKLLDFGVAKTTGGLETTRSGIAKGKPAYFSPEQARNEPLDRRSDIFSLGTVLWELAAGKPLFDRGGKFGTMRAVIDAPIPSLQDFGIDPEFDDLLRRALARDRDARYANAAEFRARLSDYATAQRWDDVHDALSSFVSDVAGEFVDRRWATATAGKSRQLSAAEGHSLVHLSSVEDLAATAPTLDIDLKAFDLDTDRAKKTGAEEVAGPLREELAQRPEPEPRPAPEPAEESARAPLRSGVRGFSIVVLGSIAVLAVTLVRWVEPTWAPALAIGVVALGAIGWSWSAAAESDTSIVRAIMPALVPGLLFLCVSAGWMLAPVRGGVARAAVAMQWSGPVGRALFDPQPAVARAVCRGLEESDLKLPQEVVTRKLSSTQPDGAACLVGQLLPDAPRTKVVLDYLLPRWSEDLRRAADGADDELLCEKTKWMARAIKRTGRDADLSLMSCALRAHSGTAKRCCTQAYRLLALGQRGVAMSLPPAATAVENGGSEIARFLSDLWQGAETIDAGLRQSLELDSPVVRAWALSIHCEALSRATNSPGAAETLTRLKSMVGSECTLPDDIDQERAVWASACEWFFADHQFWQASGEEPRLLCREVADGVGAVTFRAARTRLAQAVDAAVAVDAPGRTRAQREENERRCTEEGDADICTRLGRMYRSGEGVEQDVSRAFAMFEEGCDAGDAAACNTAGYVLSVEMPDDTPDKKRAMDFYERACSMGESSGCANQAEEFKRGRYTRRNLERARQIYRGQCDQGVGYACGGLASMYWEGLGVSRDREQALALWKTACSSGYSRACIDLALDARTLDDRPADLPGETRLLRKGCLITKIPLCIRDMGYRYTVGRGTPQDDKRAARYFAWACELGDDRSCDR